MENLNGLIGQAGLTVIEKLDYNENSLYWADYCSSKYKTTISRYCFIKTSYQFWKEFIYENDSFVKEVIEQKFFENKNDLRWNLYLVCVFTESELALIPMEERFDFEENKEYTRNLLVRESEFGNMIPAGKIFSINQDNENSNPLSDWSDILTNDGLEFCLDAYNSSNLELFSKDEKERITTKKTVIPENKVEFNQIQTINIEVKYRENCFGRKYQLPLKSVNLLNGRNGTGKTSILDGIELSLTGKVRKTKNDFGDTKEQGVSLQLDNQELLIPENVQEEKQRENFWYKSRETTYGNKSNLNQMFHLYNYFTVEETFLFAYTQDQPDFNQNFTRLLFGDDVTKTEHNWRRYKKEAEQISNSLDLKLEQYNSEMKELKEITLIDKPQLIAYWNNSDFDLSEEVDLEKMQSCVAEFMAAHDRVADLSVIETSAELQERLNRLPELDEEISIKQEYNRKYERYQSIRLKMEENNKALLKYSDFNRNLLALSKMRTLLHYISLKEQEYNEYCKWENRLVQLSSIITVRYDEFYRTFHEFSESMINYESVMESAISREDINVEYQQISSEMTVLKEIIEQEKQKIGELNHLYTTFKNHGSSYVEKLDGLDVCPMCGNTNVTKHDVLGYLAVAKSDSDDSYDALYKEFNCLKSRESETMQLLKEADKNKEKLERISQAYEMIKQFEIGEITYNETSLFNKLHVIQNVLHNYEALLEEKNSLLEFQEKWEEKVSWAITDIKADELKKLPDYIEKTQQKFQGYGKEIINGQSIKVFSDELSLHIREMENEIEELEDNKYKLKEELEIANIECACAKALFEDYHHKVQEKKQQREQILRMINFWNEIDGIVKKNHNLSSEALYNQAMRLESLLSDERSSNQVKEKKELLCQKAENTVRLQKRYKIVIDTLGKLKESRLYADDFIKNNIAHISHIFLNLHSPKEYSALKLTENGILVAIRDREEIPIYRLSTGQKTAVALSVFFKMNLSAVNAPNIIMLDEPVANIDDMNVLSMFDLLREITLATERQIFITTANYNVGKLFRRKFSFMNQDFQELSCNRKKDLKTEIVLKTYNQETCIHEQKI